MNIWVNVNLNCIAILKKKKFLLFCLSIITLRFSFLSSFLSLSLLSFFHFFLFSNLFSSSNLFFVQFSSKFEAMGDLHIKVSVSKPPPSLKEFKSLLLNAPPFRPFSLVALENNPTTRDGKSKLLQQVISEDPSSDHSAVSSSGGLKMVSLSDFSSEATSLQFFFFFFFSFFFLFWFLFFHER